MPSTSIGTHSSSDPSLGSCFLRTRFLALRMQLTHSFAGGWWFPLIEPSRAGSRSRGRNSTPDSPIRQSLAECLTRHSRFYQDCVRTVLLNQRVCVKLG